MVFTGAHGLSAGDIIRADDYGTVVARQSWQAFLGLRGVLGGADAGAVLG